MKIHDYLIDHIPHTIFWIIGLLLLDVGLWLLPHNPVPLSYLAYLDVILTVLYLIFLVLVYFYRARWYHSLSAHQDLKAAALDIPLTGAQNHSQKYMQNYINALRDYHQQQLSAIIQKQQAQQTFVESWVHDIKVPLSATKLLLESVSDQLSEDKQNQFRTEWAKMDHAVDQILYYSRLENFSNDYLLRDYDVRAIAITVVQNNMSYFFQKQIHFKIDESSMSVLTDEKWLQYCLEQIISNALKYTPPKGTISISQRQDAAGRYLDVADTGIGIAPDDLPRIFDKGFTGKNGRQANQKATGLGLYLAYQLCEKLGHHLSVQSKVGGGSVFTISFPYLNYYTESYGEAPLKATPRSE